MTGLRKSPTRAVFCIALLMLAFSSAAIAQTCFAAGDMDESTRSALESAAKRYFEMAARADSGSMKQMSIAALASDFAGVEAALKDHREDFSGAQATSRPPFLLKTDGGAPQARSEFLCGVFGKNGQTANSAEFVIANLAPGVYGIVTLDVAGKQNPQTVSFVLQHVGPDWKLGGFYVRASQVAGHDAQWFAEKARSFKEKGQNRNAWFYYLEARELAVPMPFMYTQMTDKLFDESQSMRPSELPVEDTTLDLVVGGATRKLTAMFPLPVGKDLDLIVKYQSSDVSDTAKTFQENIAVIKALVAKYPELRDAFDGMVARAVEPSGRDYGSLLGMKEIN